MTSQIPRSSQARSETACGLLTVDALSYPYKTQRGRAFAHLYAELQKETGQLVPPRAAFQPKRAKQLLSHITILEARGPGELMVRLSGTAVVERTGRNLVGRNVLDIMPDRRQEVWDFYWHELATPCGGAVELSELQGRHIIPLEVVSFPFCNAEGVPTIVFIVSAEIDPQSLLLKGEETTRLGAPRQRIWLNIGAGVNVPSTP